MNEPVENLWILYEFSNLITSPFHIVGFSFYWSLYKGMVQTRCQEKLLALSTFRMFHGSTCLIPNSIWSDSYLNYSIVTILIFTQHLKKMYQQLYVRAAHHMKSTRYCSYYFGQLLPMCLVLFLQASFSLESLTRALGSNRNVLGLCKLCI